MSIFIPPSNTVRKPVTGYRLPRDWYKMLASEAVEQSRYYRHPTLAVRAAIIAPHDSNIVQRHQSLQRVIAQMCAILSHRVVFHMARERAERYERLSALHGQLLSSLLPSVAIGFEPEDLRPCPSGDAVLDAELEDEMRAIQTLLDSAPRYVARPSSRRAIQRRTRALLPRDVRARRWRKYAQATRDYRAWQVWYGTHATEALWQRIVAAAARVAKYVCDMRSEIDAQLHVSLQVKRMRDIVQSLSDEQISAMPVHCTHCGSEYDEVTCPVSKREVLTGHYCGQVVTFRDDDHDIVRVLCAPPRLDQRYDALIKARRRTSRHFHDAFYGHRSATSRRALTPTPMSDEDEAWAIEQSLAYRKTG